MLIDGRYLPNYLSYSASTAALSFSAYEQYASFNIYQYFHLSYRIFTLDFLYLLASIYFARLYK